MEGYLVGIFIISFLISETVESSSLTVMYYIALFSRLTSDSELCDELYTYFCSPNTMKDKVSLSGKIIYICV